MQTFFVTFFEQAELSRFSSGFNVERSDVLKKESKEGLFF